MILTMLQSAEQSAGSGGLTLILVISVWALIIYFIVKAVKKSHNNKQLKIELLKEQNRLIAEQNQLLKNKGE